MTRTKKRGPIPYKPSIVMPRRAMPIAPESCSAWQDRIDEIMDGFDFRKVHSVMQLLDWRWKLDDGFVIPTEFQIRRCARTVLRDAIRNGVQGACKTGGLAARRDGEYIELSFEVDLYWAEPSQNAEAVPQGE